MVDGVFLDVGEQLDRDLGEPALGVAVGRRRGSPSTEPKLPWPSTSMCRMLKVLRHAHERVVDAGVAVRVVVAEHLTRRRGAHLL